MAKREYNIEDRDKVEDALHMMLSATTETEYETGRRYLYYVVDGKEISLEEDIPEATHPCLKYFHDNWHKCRDMWSGFGRIDVPHLGNTTNNRGGMGSLSDSCQPSSSSSEECSFFLSKSTKTRGRPEIRETQKQQVKKQRMTASRKEAKQLVQGTLLPVTTLSNVDRVMKSAYSYESAYGFLSSFAVKTMGPRKQAIPKVITPDKTLSSVKFVLTEQFTIKCKKALATYRKSLSDPKSLVGVRIAKIGVISEKQLQIMTEYHGAMKTLAGVDDVIEWMAATSLNRLDIPECLNEYAKLDTEKSTAALQQVILPMSRKTPFGMVSNQALFLFRQNVWLSDDSMVHAMTTLQEEYGPIGIISPGVTGSKCAETRDKIIINGSQPFLEENTRVMLPIHINSSHWCGAVFDFASEPSKIIIMDPQQRNEHFEECEAIVESLFPELAAKMALERNVLFKQPGGTSCGPLVLIFFECYVRGIDLRKTPSKALLRYLRMRYLLKSLHV